MKKNYILLIALFAIQGVNAQWVTQNSGTTNSLNSVYYTDVNTGYIVGDGGTILKTFDGGINWVSLPSGTQYNLASVHFPIADTGYAVGNYYYGTILKTIDAGMTWTILVSSYAAYYSVYFTSADTGYVTESYDMGSGNIMKTIDGGNAWNFTDVGWQFGICFPNALTGYSVGVNGQIWSYGTINKTIDGGSTWVNIFSLADIKLNSVYFIDPEKGYVVGNGGTVLKTTDGGINWENQTSGTVNNLTSVYFTDADIGYVVGESGTIMKTTNGGITWENQTSGTFNDLTSVYFTDADTGYVVGDDGTILKTMDGGGPPVEVTERSLNSGSLKIYPNPSSDKITIETSEKLQKSYLSIYNLNGMELLKQHILESKSIIDISSLPSGIYLVKVLGDKTVQIGKIIKE